MGGGGGGYFSGRSGPGELAKRAREAEESIADAEFKAKVGGVIADSLAQFNDRDIDETRRVLNQVCEDLGERLEEKVETLFGGSVAKHTYVDGLSDVDALVVLRGGADDLASPQQLRRLLARDLRARHGDAAVEVGDLAVTVTIGNTCLQLLPARRDGDRVYIGSRSSDEWTQIRPRQFTDKLTRTNKLVSGKVVPTIKLAKSIMSGSPEQKQVTGYHMESLAIDAFRRGFSKHETPQMLQHFFQHASKAVLTPIRDSTKQSVHVDEYLGAANSVARRIRADEFARIARRIKNANGAQSIAAWEQLLGRD